MNALNSIARSSYAGCHHDTEAPIDKDNHGLLFLNNKVKYSEIYDGSSQTILIGEALTSPDGLGWVSGTRATLRNTSVIEQSQPRFGAAQKPADEKEKDKEKAGSLFVGGFGSSHPGGANFGFADGSTRFVRQSVEPELLRRLGNRADGEIIKNLE
jgi:prepilin-type processing-associated H-X9-DG protein